VLYYRRGQKSSYILPFHSIYLGWSVSWRSKSALPLGHTGPRMLLDVHSSLKDVVRRRMSFSWTFMARTRTRIRARVRTRIKARAMARFNFGHTLRTRNVRQHPWTTLLGISCSFNSPNKYYIVHSRRRQ